MKSEPKKSEEGKSASTELGHQSCSWVGHGHMEQHPGWGVRVQDIPQDILREDIPQRLSGVMQASTQEWQPNIEIRVPKPVRSTKE